MTAHPSKFSEFSDLELGSLTRAMAGAAGDGAFGTDGDIALARELEQELLRRGWARLAEMPRTTVRAEAGSWMLRVEGV